MPRESKANKRKRALAIADRMDERYPQAVTLLSHHDPFTLAIAVLLSAQTTDAAVNRVTPLLFESWPTAQALAEADPKDVEELIKNIGLHRVKAKNCVRLAQMLLECYGGEVPSTMEELQRLPGVGRKSANIILNQGFGIVEGIAVDTHVFRIAHKLGLSSASTPDKVEADLLQLFPKERWEHINHQWVLFGREVCIARRPRCGECPLCDLCPSSLA